MSCERRRSEPIDLNAEPWHGSTHGALVAAYNEQRKALRYLRELALDAHGPCFVSDEVIRLTGGAS